MATQSELENASAVLDDVSTKAWAIRQMGDLLACRDDEGLSGVSGKYLVAIGVAIRSMADDIVLNGNAEGLGLTD